MAITRDDITLYKSADMTSDPESGGGFMGTELIVTGEAHNVHGPISRKDRLQGDIDAKKVWIKTTSAGTESYEDPHSIVHAPFDPQVSCLLFPATGYGDHLQDIIDYIEKFFVVAQPAGSAGLDEAAKVGEQMIRFVLVHREYTPHYDNTGNPVWTTKVDAKYTLDVAIGELLYIGTEGGNGEFVQVQRAEFHVEELTDSDDTHFYYKKYMVLTLPSPLLHDHDRGEIPRRTDRNPAWFCNGAMELAEDVEPGSNTLPVVSTKARLAPVMTRASSVLKQPVYDAPGYATDEVVERAGSKVTVPMTPQHQVSFGVPVDGSFYTIGDLPDSVPGSVEIHYPSGGNWYTARESDTAPDPDDGSRNIEGEGSGTVTRVVGTGITLSCSQPPDAGAHILIYLVRAHGFEVHSKSEILGNVESDSTPIGSHDEVGPGEKIWQVATGEHTGEAHPITGGDMAIILSRPLLPKKPLEVWHKNETGTFTRLFYLANETDTRMTKAVTADISATVNFGGSQIQFADLDKYAVSGSLHVIYTSGVMREVVLSPPTVQATGQIGQKVFCGKTHLARGQVCIGIKTTLRRFENGQWELKSVNKTFVDNGDGVLFGRISSWPTCFIDYDTGMIELSFGWGEWAAHGEVEFPTQIVDPYGPTYTVTASQYFDNYISPGPFKSTSDVIIDESLTAHAITPGTLKLYDGDSATGPWSQIGTDNGRGVVASDKGSGTLSYADGKLNLAWNEAGYDKHLKAEFTEERHIIDYATRFVAALDFGTTDLIPNGVAGSYVSEFGNTWKFTDDGQGNICTVLELPWEQVHEFASQFNPHLIWLGNGRSSSYFKYISDLGWTPIRGTIKVTFDDGKTFRDLTLPSWTSITHICEFMDRLIVLRGGQVYSYTLEGLDEQQLSIPGLVGDVKSIFVHGATFAVLSDTQCITGADLSAWDVHTVGDANQALIMSDGGALIVGAAHLWVTSDWETWKQADISGVLDAAYDGVRERWWVIGEKRYSFSQGDTQWLEDDAHVSFAGQMRRIVISDAGTILIDDSMDKNQVRIVSSPDGGSTWVDQTSSLPESVLNEADRLDLCTKGNAILVAVDFNENPQDATPTQLLKWSETLQPYLEQVGTLDYAAGTGTIHDGELPATARMDIGLSSIHHTECADWTRGGAPVTPGSYVLTAKGLDGSDLTATGQDSSNEIDGDATGVYNAELGYAVAQFNKPIDLASLRRSFNYKASFKPSASSGVNTTSLPLDGLVPVVRRENILVITDRQRYRLASAIDDAVTSLDLAESLGWPPVLPDPCTIKIEEEQLRVTGRAGNALTVERGAGTTTAVAHAKDAEVVLLTYAEEMNIAHTVTDTKVFTANNLAHQFAAGAEVLSVLQHGDRFQAAVTSYHTQGSWDGALWQDADEYTGDPAAGTFDFVNFPIEVTNLGAMTDRWIAKVTGLSPLTLEIRGERHGVVISSANATADIVAINPRGGQLFLVPAGIWGAGGQQIGEVYCWSTRGTEKSYWSVRVTNAQASDATNDGCVHETRGDVAV